jgi:pimeloyl-ACP methyl ester carboxylesterase
MDERPETRYVAIGDADVGYQVLGNGPRDLLYFYGLGSHIDFLWDGPAAEFMRRLASFSRVILFDRRGTGASHGVSAGAPLPGRSGPRTSGRYSTPRHRNARPFWL